MRLNKSNFFRSFGHLTDFMKIRCFPTHVCTPFLSHHWGKARTLQSTLLSLSSDIKARGHLTQDQYVKGRSAKPGSSVPLVNLFSLLGPFSTTTTTLPPPPAW